MATRTLNIYFETSPPLTDLERRAMLDAIFDAAGRLERFHSAAIHTKDDRA